MNKEAIRNTVFNRSIHSWRKTLEVKREDPSSPLHQEVPALATHNITEGGLHRGGIKPKNVGFEKTSSQQRRNSWKAETPHIQRRRDT